MRGVPSKANQADEISKPGHDGNTKMATLWRSNPEPREKPMKQTRAKRQKAYDHGRLAEKLCQWALRFKGYAILEVGYRTRAGEIDVLAARGGWLVAVEVKARADRGTAIESITWRQRRRIERALQWYLRGHPEQGVNGIRFDVFLVAPWRIPAHIENAWRVNE
jgi:putative endonuclease